MNLSKLRSMVRFSIGKKPDNFDKDWNKKHRYIKRANFFFPIKAVKEKLRTVSERNRMARGLFVGMFGNIVEFLKYSKETIVMLFNPSLRKKDAGLTTVNLHMEKRTSIAKQMIILSIGWFIIFIFWVNYVKSVYFSTRNIPLFSMGSFVFGSFSLYAFTYYKSYKKYSGMVSSIMRGYVNFLLSKNDFNVLLYKINKGQQISKKGLNLMLLTLVVIVFLNSLVLIKVVISMLDSWSLNNTIDILTMPIAFLIPLVVLMFFQFFTLKSYK